MIVDDDADIREVLRLLLASDGYLVREAATGEEALTALAPDVSLVLLDVMMPGIDGYTACEMIRRTSQVPVLFLTAKAQEADTVQGLRRGGDDYLAKPFSPAELSARVHALIRRSRMQVGAQPEAEVLRRGDVEIDLKTGEARRAGQRVPLTGLESKLLLCLATRAGETVDARTLYEMAWQETYLLSSAGTVMVHIRNLRKKLEQDANQPALIKTVWGGGYRID